MKAVITKCRIIEIVRSEDEKSNVKVICETIKDFTNMSASEIIQSGGIQKYVFYLRNCIDKIKELSEKLCNKIIYVCVYKFEVYELTQAGTEVKVLSDGKEIGTYTTLTYVIPCKENFIANKCDYTAAKKALAIQLEKRVNNGSYKIVDNKRKDIIKNTIKGYIELNGEIKKVTTIDDLKQIINGLGKTFIDLTEREFKELTEKSLSSSYKDDCGCTYSENLLYDVKNYSNQYKVQEGTIAIHWGAFYHYDCINKERYAKQKIENILLPQSLIAIGRKAFRYNIFKNIELPDSVQYIGDEAFMDCDNWECERLSLPMDLRFMGTRAFRNCCKIKTVVLNENIKVIHSMAFQNCTSLEWAYIPNTVEEIGSGIFDGCTNLSHIYIPIGSRELFERFFPFDRDKLTEIEKNEI